MRGYELMYILDPTLDEDATQALVGQVEEFMTKQGVALEKTEPWGKRRLAYPIGKHWEGYYVLSYFQAGAGVVTELERRLRVIDGVMRFITVRVDEEEEKRERRRAKKQAAARPRGERPEASATGEDDLRAEEDTSADSSSEADGETDADTVGEDAAGRRASTDEDETSEPGEAI